MLHIKTIWFAGARKGLRYYTCLIVFPLCSVHGFTNTEYVIKYFPRHKFQPREQISAKMAFIFSSGFMGMTEEGKEAYVSCVDKLLDYATVCGQNAKLPHIYCADAIVTTSVRTVSAQSPLSVASARFCPVLYRNKVLRSR